MKKLFKNEKQHLYENARVCCIFNKKFPDKYIKDKKYCKFIDGCHYIYE